MKRMIARALVLMSAACTLAEADSLEEVRSDLDLVKNELRKLQAENSELREQLARGITAPPVVDIRKPDLAQRVDAIEKSASRLSWRGDFRYCSLL